MRHLVVLKEEASDLSQRLVNSLGSKVERLDKSIENGQILLVGDVLADHVLVQMGVFTEKMRHLPRVGRFH